MSARPWMPLHIPDYLADTAHLGALESGAYLHLIFHYWQHGALPADNKELARIAKVSSHSWKKLCPVIQKFFYDGWKHKRIEKELARACEISEKRSAAAKSRHNNKPANAGANAVQKHTHPQPHTHKERKKVPAAEAAAPTALEFDLDVVGEDPKSKLYRVGKTILVSFGIVEKRTGQLIGMWLKAKPDPVGLLAAIQFARNQNVAEPVSYVSALVNAKDKPNGTDRKQSLGDRARELAEQARELERAAGIGRPAVAV